MEQPAAKAAHVQDLRSELDEARTAALALELAITGAMARGILDDGPLGQSLEDAAGALSDRLIDLCERPRWRSAL